VTGLKLHLTRCSAVTEKVRHALLQIIAIIGYTTLQQIYSVRQ